MITFHNTYTKAVCFQMLWANGARGLRIPRLTFERIFSNEAYIAISDRKVDRYSRQRVIGVTPAIHSTRLAYIAHLKSLSARLHPHSASDGEEIDSLASGKKPHRSAFNLYVKSDTGWKLRPIRRKDLVELLIELGEEVSLQFTSDDLNVARHFLFTKLVTLKVEQVAIESFLGHHIVGYEPHGIGAGVAARTNPARTIWLQLPGLIARLCMRARIDFHAVSEHCLQRTGISSKSSNAN